SGVAADGSRMMIVGSSQDTAGSNQDDGWLVLVNPDGSIFSQSSYGGDATDRFVAGMPLPGGGYAMAGGTNSFGLADNDVFVVRTAADPRIFFFNSATPGGHVRTTTAVRGAAVTVSATTKCINVAPYTTPPTGGSEFGQSFPTPNEGHWAP